jgi:hypothetical protein
MSDVVGILERRDPIPPGIYWVDIVSTDFGQYLERREAFYRWARSNAGAVKVLQETDSPRVAPTYYSTAFHRWVLFEVLSATSRWPVSAGLGFPNVAAEGEKTKSEDTVQRPDPEPLPSPWEMLSGGVGLLALLWLLSKK